MKTRTTTTIHCTCCHEQFNPFDTAPSWHGEPKYLVLGQGYCGTCNADGCSPGCYAFDIAENTYCTVCHEGMTTIQAEYRPHYKESA